MTQEKVVAYCRVSTVKQASEKTIEQQEEIIKEYAIKNPEIQITQWFKDDGESGFKGEKERKEYSKMIDFLRNNPDIDGVVVRDLSRLGRDAFELMRFDKKVIKKLDKRLIMINLNVDTKTKEGKLIYNNMAGLVEFQARDIKERLAYGRQKKYKENPEIFGRPKKLTDPVILKRIKKLYEMNHLGVYNIAKILKSEGLKVCPGTIRNRLKEMDVKFRKPKWRKNLEIKEDVK